MTNSSETFQIILREGITGGFVGPTVKQVVQITGDDAGAFVVHGSAKGTSKNDFSTQSGSLSSEQVKPLIQFLKETLPLLPTETPPGSEDIYGLDISVGFMSDELKWQNGGPEGCVSGGKSQVQPTAHQKQLFQTVVQSLVGTGQQYAVQAQD